VHIYNSLDQIIV